MKNRAFTIVELIASIAIIAMLATVLTVVLTRRMNSIKEAAYDTLIESIELAAQDYATNNEAILSSYGENDWVKIPLETLIARDYFDEDLINPKTKEEILSSDFVYVTRTYKGKLDALYNENQNEETNIVLNGKYNIYIKKDTTYTELGVVATDENGSNVTNQVETTGTVDTSIEGVYVITYTYQDVSIERNVIIGESDEISTSWYSLILNPSLGTFNGSSTTTIYRLKEGRLQDLSSITRSGYTFNGWTKTCIGCTISGANIFAMGTSNAEVTANWTAYPTLTVNLNSGTTGQTFNASYAPNSTITLAAPTRAGYAFNNWTVSGTGSTIVGTTLTIGTGNTTITANWIALMTLTVNLNGGTSGQTFNAGYPTGTTITLIQPSRAGYSFVNWTVSGTGSTIVGTTLTIGTATTTITANWLSLLPIYTYTGSSTLIDDGSGNWRIKFLTSGTFTPSSDMQIEVFLVGGGGGGGSGAGQSNFGGSGGGGGYTSHKGVISITSNTPYAIVVGAGGGSSASGAASTAFGYSAAGGVRGVNGGLGGVGGSGGGSFGASQSAGTWGGSDGGTGGFNSPNAGGAGQFTTTREFHLASGTLYSGAGGSGAFSSGAGAGGAGGGGNGANRSTSGGAGTVNTGGGGGGAGALGPSGGAGGSGIVVIRNSTTWYQVGNTTKYSFTYTGILSIVDGNTDSWKIKFLKDGTFTPNANMSISAFLVGGGGGGGHGVASNYAGTGGGAGRTTNGTTNLTSGTAYNIVLAAGGWSGTAGGTTTGFGYSATGGSGGTNGGVGAAGGSGGGAVDFQAVGKNGGTNGGNGVANGAIAGGVGQGSTTKAFASVTEELFAGGGASGAFSGAAGVGGAGGGGNGGARTFSGYTGTPNTGGGGGGAGVAGALGGPGGSGIVIIKAN